MGKIFKGGELVEKTYYTVIKGNAMPIAIVIFGICLVFSSNTFKKSITEVVSSSQWNSQSVVNGMYAIAQSNSNIGNVISNQNNNSLTINSTNNKTMLDFVDTYRYLNMSEDELNKLIANTDSKIPYLKVNGKYVFNKNALDKWLETARVEVK